MDNNNNSTINNVSTIIEDCLYRSSKPDIVSDCLYRSTQPDVIDTSIKKIEDKK